MIWNYKPYLDAKRRRCSPPPFPLHRRELVRMELLLTSTVQQISVHRLVVQLLETKLCCRWHGSSCLLLMERLLLLHLKAELSLLDPLLHWPLLLLSWLRLDSRCGTLLVVAAFQDHLLLLLLHLWLFRLRLPIALIEFALLFIVSLIIFILFFIIIGLMTFVSLITFIDLANLISLNVVLIFFTNKIFLTLIVLIFETLFISTFKVESLFSNTNIDPFNINPKVAYQLCKAVWLMILNHGLIVFNTFSDQIFFMKFFLMVALDIGLHIIFVHRLMLSGSSIKLLLLFFESVFFIFNKFVKEEEATQTKT